MNEQMAKVNISLRQDLARAGLVASEWQESGPIYMSIKTTGSGELAQVIEIAVLDTDRSVLFHCQLLPSVQIEKDVELSHGINLSALQGRPTWPSIIEKLQRLIAGRALVMFDALFQLRLLKQSCLAFELSVDWLDSLKVNCAMQLAASAYGSDNRYGTVSIEYAMKRAQVLGFSDRTGAVAACYALIHMLALTAKYSETLAPQLLVGAYQKSA